MYSDNNYSKYKDILIKAYTLFNQRDIEGILELMHKEVDWANGWEGDIEHGKNAVRSYWKRQWASIDSYVEPVYFEQENDNQIIVTVHQVVKDLNGKLLSDTMVYHIYSFENGQIKSMKIKK